MKRLPGVTSLDSGQMQAMLSHFHDYAQTL